MTVLAGKRVLVVEDEAMVAAMIEDMLLDLDAVVVGPAPSIAVALDLAAREALDCAVLDINVRGERIEPVADLLRSRGVPVVFASGYGQSGRPGEHVGPVLEKPFRSDALAAALARVLGEQGGS